MKKTLSLVLFSALLLTAALTFASCDDSQTVTLYVYNWGEYISDGSEGSLDVNREFEKYYLETYGEKIKVNYSTYSSNEDMYAKISSGGSKYDVIIPSDYMIERMSGEGLLAELDYANIPNMRYIADDFKGEGMFSYYDAGNAYSVPYTYGMFGIIYNTALVDEDDENIGSWALMWDADYAKNILQFNNPRDAFGTALYYLGYDVNEASAEQWRGALSKLKEQKPLVQGYVMDEIFNKMKSGSAAVAVYYAGDFLSMYESNNDLAFYYPEEGVNIFVDAMCIPKSSQNKLMAERYIDFMLSEEIAIANAEYTYYASPNTLVTDSEEYAESITAVHPDAMDILYSGVGGTPASFFKNLPEDKLVMLNSLWEELKIESSIGIEIYVACAVLLIALAGLVIFMVIRKKRRGNYD